MKLLKYNYNNKTKLKFVVGTWSFIFIYNMNYEIYFKFQGHANNSDSIAFMILNEQKSGNELNNNIILNDINQQGVEGNVVFLVSIMNTVISVAIIILVNSMSLMGKQVRK